MSVDGQAGVVEPSGSTPMDDVNQVGLIAPGDRNIGGAGVGKK